MKRSVVRTIIFKNKVSDYRRLLARDPNLRVETGRVSVKAFDGQPHLVVVEVSIAQDRIAMMEGWNRGYLNRIGLG